MLNNTFDIIISIILAATLLWGGYKGAIKQIASLCGVVFGIIAGRLYCEPLGNWMKSFFGMSDYLIPAIPFFLLFLGVLIAFTVAGKLLDEFFSVAGIGWFNRCMGALLSVSKWVLILSVAMNIGEMIGVQGLEDFSKKRKESRLYSPIKEAAPSLFPYIPAAIEKIESEMKQ